jgi:UDP-glucose 4-epimerase
VILLTGSKGFIGSNFLSALKNDVVEVDFEDCFDIFKKPNFFQNLDMILHQGAISSTVETDLRKIIKYNLDFSLELLSAAIKYEIPVKYASSASVYGDADEIPMTENHSFNNRNFYGASKIAGEAMARAFHDRYGLSYVGLRYMNVYGPYQDQTAAYTGVIPIMLNKIDANETPVINGDGSQAYDFITARDAARCNILALKSTVSDEFFNVGTGVQTTIKSLCEKILTLSHSDLTVKYKPYSEEDVRRLVQNRIGSTEKARNLLGFEFEENLEKGLKDLIEWRSKNLQA